MKVYIAIAINKNSPPEILGAFKRKADAEKVAYADKGRWVNIIERKVFE